MLVEAIATERLRLLPLRVEHAEEMAAVLADPALHTYIGGAPSTVERLRVRYRHLEAGSPNPEITWLNWVISLDGRLTGTVQATVGPGPTAEIAWVVGTAWQGRGIAKEAAKALVEWLGRQSVRTVVAHVHPDHHASVAVATAAGLEPTDETQDGEVRFRYSY
ncbi:GNAT family N-acetyltransferase [Kutzneria buriramensis]|uniref:RimJ/RimL family protein N-acetyltransferase n=1 Tax=Kutzneria buriramensis TaxID=1045776 RepID=A0A3E0GWG3_9PSEU|nr:GNAT family N-acetyltransferase [Kutzneria buriramensis]REH32475.1 RimJ/RimL family protein N-acetyltransferase [Kutzneria buriramensis]